MKIDLDHMRPTSVFSEVGNAECFLWSGKLYLKFNRLVVTPPSELYDGSTKDIGGYNCVCMESGRPGSFKDNTSVRPVKVVVVRDAP
jgi:hypothetical protein